MPFCALALSSLLASLLAAQDPPVPPGGFRVKTLLDQSIRWSDGYKSMMDLYYPDAPPPLTGWPFVLVIHGGGGHRAIPVNRQQGSYFARYGYAVGCYDVRGQPVTNRLNNGGGDTSQEAILRDMAEAVLEAARLLPGRIDPQRLAVTGRSMGGSHAYRAAAWSGRPLPKPGAVVKVFPKVSAVVGDWQGLLRVEEMYPGGKLAAARSVEQLYQERLTSPRAWNLAKAFRYDVLHAETLKEWARNYLPGILNNDVPVFAFFGHRDRHHMLWSVTKALPELAKAGIPHRVYVSTRGHGIPDNDIEWALHLDMKRRWWDRFLKNHKNGIDAEPLVEMGVIPADPRVYNAPKSAWKHELSATWPPAVPMTILYPARGNKLSPSPAKSASPAPPVRNRPTAGYTIESFAKDTRLSPVLSKLPLSRVPFASDPLPAERQVLGRPRFTCEVLTTKGRVQLAAVLFDLPPSGSPVYVTMGVIGLGDVAAGRYRVSFDLDDVAYSIPAGHRIGLAIQNLSIRDVPGKRGGRHLVYTPEFNSFDAVIRLGGAFPAKLELPLKGAPVSFLPRIAEVSFGSGLSHRITLDAGAEHRGEVYYTLLGTSGTGPGFTLPPRIPLNIDAWTLFATSLANTPVFQGFAGVLDAQGRATSQLRIPGPFKSEIEGLRFSFAVVGLGKNTLFTGSPAELIVHP